MAMEAIVVKQLSIVVIVSCLMGVMNGKEVGQEVKQNHDSQPIVQNLDFPPESSSSLPNIIIQNLPCNGKCKPCEETSECQKGFTMLASGKCYMFSTIIRTWFEALAVCESAGATLAYPMNAVEETVLSTYLSTQFDGTEYWLLGGNDLGKAGDWRWTHNNASITYSDWGPNEPDSTGGDERCMQYYNVGYGWKDISCDAAFPFVCQQL